MQLTHFIVIDPLPRRIIALVDRSLSHCPGRVFDTR